MRAVGRFEDGLLVLQFGGRKGGRKEGLCLDQSEQHQRNEHGRNYRATRLVNTLRFEVLLQRLAHDFGLSLLFQQRALVLLARERQQLVLQLEIALEPVVPAGGRRQPPPLPRIAARHGGGNP